MGSGAPGQAAGAGSETSPAAGVDTGVVRGVLVRFGSTGNPRRAGDSSVRNPPPPDQAGRRGTAPECPRRMHARATAGDGIGGPDGGRADGQSAAAGGRWREKSRATAWGKAARDRPPASAARIVRRTSPPEGAAMSHRRPVPTPLSVALVAAPVMLGCASPHAPVLRATAPEPAVYLASDAGDDGAVPANGSAPSAAREALASGASAVAAGVRATSGAVRDLVRALARLVGDDATPGDLFVLRQGADTLAIERVTQPHGGTRRSQLVTVARSVDVTTTARADGGVESVQLSLVPADTAQPTERFWASIVGDSIVTRSGTAGAERLGGGRVPPGTWVFMDPSPSFYELLVQHGRASGHAISAVPVLILGNPSRVVRATVAFYGDSAVVMVGDAVARLATDRDGRLRGGELADGSVIERARVMERTPPPER
jgi:hypothetical protein